MAENPADTIRRAAALMRERAEKATPSPWRDSAVDGNRYAALVSDVMPAGRKPGGGWDVTEGYGGYLIGESVQSQDRQHIASWHPAVALAIAAWLDEAAAREDEHQEYAAAEGMTDDGPVPGDEAHAALTFARAYLGESEATDGQG
jgi:hypothetical protein